MALPLPNVSPCRILMCLLLPSQLQAPIDVSLCYIAALAVHKLAVPCPFLSDHSGLRLLLESSTVSPSQILNLKDQVHMLELSFWIADSVTIFTNSYKHFICNNSAGLGNSAVNGVERKANSAKLTNQEHDFSFTLFTKLSWNINSRGVFRIMGSQIITSHKEENSVSNSLFCD